jgi:glutathione synthase/RimK-type ligase-like ATP-grasp enzyme
MKKCILLSMDNLHQLECYDRLIIEPLKQLGWHATEVSWRNKDVDWNDYDAVIIRSTWDYQEDCDAFLAVLQTIEASSALLVNPFELVQWNVSKTYLQELQRKGVMIVPTLWDSNYSKTLVQQGFEQFDCQHLIIKPCISAGSHDTFQLTEHTSEADHQQYQQLFSDRPFLLQPFMPNILTEGEYSLFYFNGDFSHAILKTPANGDFRVQEEFGGRLTNVKPEQNLVIAAQSVLAAIETPTLYTRLDFVRLNDSFALMEAELIEPSLYFNLDEHSPARFAQAFVDYYEKFLSK